MCVVRTLKQRRSELEAKDPESWFIAKGQDSLRWLIRASLLAAGAREPVRRSLWPENKKYAVERNEKIKTQLVHMENK